MFAADRCTPVTVLISLVIQLDFISGRLYSRRRLYDAYDCRKMRRDMDAAAFVCASAYHRTLRTAPAGYDICIYFTPFLFIQPPSTPLPLPHADSEPSVRAIFAYSRRKCRDDDDRYSALMMRCIDRQFVANAFENRYCSQQMRSRRKHFCPPASHCRSPRLWLSDGYGAAMRL